MERPNRVGRGRQRAWTLLRAAIPSGHRAGYHLNLKASRRGAGARRTKVATSKGKSSRPPEQTFEEIKYLKHLIEHKTPVCVKLSDGELVKGVIEYYDQRFIRITRLGAPNLFIFKHDIKYLYEAA
jgi:sRNA-binding regulator protein Hfq